MPSIRPSSDLRNNYNEISDFCNRYNEPVFITKNGTGDLVVLSNEAYERLCGQAELHKLLDAGIAQMKANKHRPASEVFEKLLQKLQELMDTIEIKHTIREYGVDEKYFLETLDEMTEQAFNDQCTGANPRYPLMKEIKEIYLKCYYGK